MTTTHADAETYSQNTRSEADAYSVKTRQDADNYSKSQHDDADNYEKEVQQRAAERTTRTLVPRLMRTTRTPALQPIRTPSRCATTFQAQSKVVEGNIQSLKQFETEYRARLTEYLGQLASQVSESNNYVDQTSSKTN